MRAQLREFPFAKLREPLKQLLARHQSEHRIAQELELLVVGDRILAVARMLRFQLPRLRAVRDRLFNHRAPPEMVPEPFLQRRYFPFLHRRIGSEPESEVPRCPSSWEACCFGWARLPC